MVSIVSCPTLACSYDRTCLCPSHFCNIIHQTGIQVHMLCYVMLYSYCNDRDRNLLVRIIGTPLMRPFDFGLNIFLFGNIYRYKDNTHIYVNKDCIER